MNDGARFAGNLDTVDRPRPNGRPAWHPSAVGNPAIHDRGGATYAALDLGTNNCRLLVARPAGEGFRVIDAFSRIVRLGEGVSASGRLSDAAMGRAVDALAVCRNKMRNRGVTRARLIATEACRMAENCEEFCTRVRERTGLELEIVDRETEAALAATGCTPLIDPDADGVILFDIGGGSSELVRLGRPQPARRGPPRPHIKSWASLPVGVVTLAERHGGMQVTRRTVRDHGRGDRRACRSFRDRARQRDRWPAPFGHLRNRDDDRRRFTWSCRAMIVAASTAAG